MIRLQLIATASVPDTPVAVALSPDGAWLAVSGRFGENQVALFDAGTYERVAVLTDSRSPWGLAFSPESDILVVGRRQGTLIGVSLPGLEEEFQVDFTSALVLTDPIVEGYYVTGRIQDVVRISREGEITARFEDDGADRIALSWGGDILFVDSALADHRIFALRTPSLEVLDDQPLLLGRADGALVPLRSGKVLALAGHEILSGPVMGVIYDPVAGEVGQPDTVDPTTGGLAFGGGSPWTAIGDGLILVPVNTGTLVVDDMTGEVVQILRPEDYPDLDGVQPCCDVVYDERRDRVIFTSIGTNQILVFEIDR